jgi:choline-sulfatase
MNQNPPQLPISSKAVVERTDPYLESFCHRISIQILNNLIRFVLNLRLQFSLILLGVVASLSASETRPNVLFIFSDDQSHEALSHFGSQVATPNLDRLAEEGTVFNLAYNPGSWTGAVCLASRTMLNTGRFLWAASALNSEMKAGATPEGFWSQLMEQAGYDTYFAGKWHVEADPEVVFQTTANVRGGMPKQNKSGYHRPAADGSKDQWKPWDPEEGGFWEGGKHWSEVLGDDGVGFLETTAQNEAPFFIYLAFNAPHDPRQSPKEYVERYPVDSIDLPENFLPEYPHNQAMGSGRNLRDERLAPFPRTEHAVKMHRQEYYAIITHMDTQIGRILDALDASGKADETYIFFTSDHGLAVGRHGLMGKQSMYEHSARAPLIVCGPDIPAGKIIETPVYLQDIMPTTLEIAGARVPDSVYFKSLLPLIRGERQEQYPAIYGAYRGHQRMVRLGDYKLIHYPKVPKTLLFDLSADPLEMNNLSQDPEYSEIIRQCMEALRNIQAETGDELEVVWPE